MIQFSMTVHARLCHRTLIHVKHSKMKRCRRAAGVANTGGLGREPYTSSQAQTPLLSLALV